MTMKIKVGLINLVVKTLTESMNVATMESIMERMIRNYNLHERTGFPLSFPIPNIDAAKQIVDDIIKMGILPHLIGHLIDIHYNGLMGRKLKIPYLREIIKELYDLGFIYDNLNKMFVENPEFRKTRNWGALRNNEEYILTFLRLDIVGNSELVRKYPEKTIKATYNDLNRIVEKSMDKRNGRIWSWEGDGGLVAFYFANKNQLATLSGIEISHNLFLYNQMECKLDSPLGVRMAIHSGFCDYSKNIEDLNKSETVKQVIKIESKYTKPNSLTISSTVYTSLDSELANHFSPIDAERGTKHYNYQLRWEQ